MMPYLSPHTGPSAATTTFQGVIESKKNDVPSPSLKAESLLENLTTTIQEESNGAAIDVKYPLIKLDVDKITDATAGRLATSLLGHVLFLKNQVPFPVMQMGRLPGGKTNSRAAKLRTELLTSYDTISSHLDTTFSALSTALARCAGRDSKLAQVHLAILVGPSLTTAKSRLILGIDGLEPSVWGTRDDVRTSQNPVTDDEEEDDVENDDDKSAEDDTDEENDESDELPDDSEDEDRSEHGGEEGGESESEEAESGNELETEDSPPPPHVSRAEELRFLQNAERLLSRKLAAADAEGNGISSELSPTQTHILIRAPRRFNHPAWLPRQNVSAPLDTALQEFFNNSGLGTGKNSYERRPKLPKQQKVEGVWITTRQGLRPSPLWTEHSLLTSSVAKDLEEDEMIWWSWDGKFQGFSDW